MPPADVKSLLRRHGLRPNRRLGQNFLQDRAILRQIAAEARVGTADTVLEIGSGLGSLTSYLAVAARRVVAVEVDSRLAEISRELLGPHTSVEIISANILDVAPQQLGLPRQYVVVANIPYNITSPILRHLLESDPQPRRIVLTVQEEVAERVCARPPAMSVLALSVQVYGAPEIVARIPATSFFPVPKVDSAVVRAEIYDEPLIPSSLLPLFFRLIKAGFRQRRKTLRNALSSGFEMSATNAERWLDGAGIDPRRRAETLEITDWKRLCLLGGAVGPAPFGA